MRLVVIAILFLVGIPLARILFSAPIAELNILQILLGFGGIGAVIAGIAEIVRYFKHEPVDSTGYENAR